MGDLKQDVERECDNRSLHANETIPIYHKLNLTLKEAAEYSNIGINRLTMMDGFRTRLSICAICW